MFLSARNGRDDTDLVTIFQLGLLVLEESNILLVHIDIDEAANGAGLVQQTFLEAGVASLQLRYRLVDRGCVYFNDFFVVRQLSQRSGNSNCFCHKIN